MLSPTEFNSFNTLILIGKNTLVIHNRKTVGNSHSSLNTVGIGRSLFDPFILDVAWLCMVLQISTKKSKVMINLQWKYSSEFKIISMIPKGKADKIFRMKLLIGYIHIHPDFNRTKTKVIFAFSFLDKAHTLTFSLLPLNYING